MATRYYSSVAAETTLVASITNANTSIQISSATGLPALTPFTLALDYEAATEELVEVTDVAGTTLTVTRGIDGTSAASHNAGARVRHVSSARDFSDSRTHEETATNVHGLGVGSSVVGTTDAQTLSNKTLNDATGTLSDIDILASALWTTTVSGTAAGTADLLRVYRDPSAAHDVMKVTNNGAVYIRNQDAAADSVYNTYRIRITFDDGTTDVFRVLSGGQVDIFGKDPTASVLDVQAAAAQSGDIMRVQNSSAATLMAIQSNGRTLANVGATIAQPGVTSGAVLQVGGSNVGYTGNLTQWVSPSNTIVANITETGAVSAASYTDGGTFSSVVATSTPTCTVTAGWTLTSITRRLRGGVTFCTIVMSRSGADIVVPASGNITPDLMIVSTLGAEVTPPEAMYVHASTGVNSGSVRINTDQTIDLVDWAPGTTMSTGVNLRFSYTYIE